MRWFSTHLVLLAGILMLLAMVPHRVETTESVWQAAESETKKLHQINLLAVLRDDESLPYPPRANVELAGDILDKEDDREPHNERTESTPPYYALFNQTTTHTKNSQKLTSAVTESIPIAHSPLFLLTQRIRQ